MTENSADVQHGDVLHGPFPLVGKRLDNNWNKILEFLKASFSVNWVVDSKEPHVAHARFVADLKFMRKLSLVQTEFVLKIVSIFI